jgi:UDPglucose 6-dehydrogenase
VNICVIGGGFVGLVAAAGFAEFGHSVVCVEKNPEYLKSLQSGRVPFFERDLGELIAKHLESERLSFSGDLDSAIEGQQAIFITVGTPSSSTGRAELNAIDDVVTFLSRRLKPEQVVVLKSTVPVGTGMRIRELLKSGNTPASVVNNPEFLREGSAVYDFFHPQRIVLGGDNPAAVQLVSDIYRLGMINPVPILTTNNETAEMIKYASNAFLATKVGFINELAGLCDTTGVNVLEVARGMGLDPRIGPEFLEPGPGWGGSCFGKDMREFTGLALAKNFQLLIGEAVLASNKRQFSLVVDKVRSLVGSLAGKRIGVLGLSFKANTSDMRDSASIPIIQELVKAGADVLAYDPQAHIDAPNYLPELKLAANAYEVAADADCLLILTEWQEFQLLDFKKLAGTMKSRNIVDVRNLLVPELLQRFGFSYAGMGQS